MRLPDTLIIHTKAEKEASIILSLKKVFDVLAQTRLYMESNKYMTPQREVLLQRAGKSVMEVVKTFAKPKEEDEKKN